MGSKMQKSIHLAYFLIRIVSFIALDIKWVGWGVSSKYFSCISLKSCSGYSLEVPHWGTHYRTSLRHF